MIPYGRQLIDDDDVAAVVEVLRSDWLTTGPAVERFEHDLATEVGARYAVAFSSGTAALHGAAAAAGIGPGDTVATSTLSFAASATCARYVGADVVLVDVDERTLNIDLDLVPAEIDALVAVHFAGLPVDLSGLRRRPRVVIEDAAHALGSATPDGPVGSCAHSDMAVFSFHPVKAITTGEGGAVTTNSEELAERLRRFRSHDIRRTPEEGGWAYRIDGIGFNYRLTDIQAALGSSQLRKLDRFIARRNEIAGVYRDALAGLDLELPPAAPPGWRHAYHLFAVRVGDRRRVYDELHRRGVAVQVHYAPIHRHPLHSTADRRPSHVPAAERAGERLLSLPIFPGLGESEISYVVDTVREVVGQASSVSSR